jgi:ankyrin repeat protein
MPEDFPQHPNLERTGEEAAKELLLLVGHGRTAEVRSLLLEAPHLVNAAGPHPFWGGRPQPLHVSIETGRQEIFDLLLAAGADVRGSNDQYEHWSPLMLAIHRHRDSMRDQLLRRGAPAGLVEALMLGDDRLTEELLRSGAPGLPSCVPGAGSILKFARTPFAIDRLLELGVPADLPDRWGTTPAQAISRLGETGRLLLSRLLVHGVPVSPTELARTGDLAALASLIEAKPDMAVSEDVTIAAVESGNVELVRWLIARGANVNSRSSEPSQHTALHAAAWNGNLAMARLLAEAGADLNLRDKEHNGTAQDWADAAITIRNDPKCAEVAAYLGSRRDR